MSKRSPSGPSQTRGAAIQPLPRAHPAPAVPDVSGAVPPVPWWMPIVLLLAGAAVYLNSLTAPFILDDDQILLALADLRDGELANFLLSTRRVLVHLTMWLNHRIGGTDPLGYHLFNTGVHLVAGLALFGIVRRTLHLPLLRDRFAPTANLLAFATALLWLVHPLNTQAVTYTIQRSESMMGVFFLLTVYAAIRHLEASRAGLWFIIATVCSVAGMLSKEVMVAAPVLIVLYDWCFTREPIAALLRRRGLLYAVLFATIAVLLIPQPHAAASAGFAYESLTPWQYALTQPLIVLKYLKLSVWPHPLVLDHMHPAQHTLFDRANVPWAISLIQLVAPIVIVLAMAAVTVHGLVRRRTWVFLPAWFFIILAPTSSILPIADIMVEHRMYLSLIAVVFGLLLIVHTFLHRRANATPRTFAIALIVPALVLSGMTINRNNDYRSRLTIWQTVVDRRPHNPRGWHHLGSAWFAAGDFNRAYECWRRTVELGPRSFPEAYLNLARIELDRGDPVAAIDWLDRALTIKPDDLDFHVALGIAQMAQNNRDAAVAAFEHVLRDDTVRPTDPRRARARAANALAGIHIRERNFDAAEQSLEQALTFDPQLVDAHVNRGTMLAMNNRFAEAIEAWRGALAIDPDRVDVYTHLGEVHLIQGDYDQAETFLFQALELNAHHAPAVEKLIQLSFAHAQRARFPRATQLLQTAIAIIQSWQGDPRRWQELVPVLEAFREKRLPGTGQGDSH